MSKSKRSHYAKMPGSDVFWQSAAFNSRIYEMYRQWLLSLAVNRFKWVNLPPTVDERYLELQLCLEGVASLATFADTGILYGLQAVPSAQPNAYDRYDNWRALGQNGFTYDASTATGVLVWDNRMRLPVAGALDVFARRLTAIDRTLDINMLQQRTPFIITGPQEKVADITNVFKQIAGGEPAIIGYSSLAELIKVEAVSTGVPCIAADINNAKTQIWNELYRFLGIDALNQKSERLITSEADVQTEPSELMALDPLTARREACDAYNDLFSSTFVAQYGPLDVVWRRDWESDNFDFDNDRIVSETVGGGE